MIPRSKLTSHVGALLEAKAFGTRVRPNIDLRSLEARAYAIVHKREYPAIVARQTGLALKQLESVKRRLRIALLRDVKSWRRGEIGYTTLIKKSRSQIESAYREAYLHGIKSQGHGALRGARATKLSPTDALRPDDLEWIKSAADEEMKYWTRFMKSMANDYDQIEKQVYNVRAKEWQTHFENVKREQLSGYQQKRLDMYVSTVDSLFSSGQVHGAPDFVIIDWVLGVAEHCPECLYLSKHSPYTKETLPCTPRSGCTRCLSNCKCKLLLTPVDKSRYDALNRRRNINHLRRLQMSRTLRRGLPEVASMLVKEEAKERVRRSKVPRGNRR